MGIIVVIDQLYSVEAAASQRNDVVLHTNFFEPGCCKADLGEAHKSASTSVNVLASPADDAAPLSIESTSLHRVAAVPNSSESAGEASSAWLTVFARGLSG
eukprot:3261158-Prymnesium_polylepis.1